MGVPHKTAACKKHGETDFFWHSDKRQTNTHGRWECVMCSRESAYRAGHRPMSEAKDSPVYLGVYIGERILSKFFDNVQRMPHCNRGYDFLCGKGFKIDAKASCISLIPKSCSPRWRFHIRRHKVPDYFLCLGLDNRENLNPCHVWLFPGHVINNLDELSICDTPAKLSKWAAYEKPLDRVIACCNRMKAEA